LVGYLGKDQLVEDLLSVMVFTLLGFSLDEKCIAGE
jgi:hypothetical protein